MQVFDLDPKEHLVLKEMWRINNKIASGERLSSTEKAYFEAFLELVQNYYQVRAEYWSNVTH